jgi:hypothetical protein
MSIISGYPHSLQLAFACYHLSSLFFDRQFLQISPSVFDDHPWWKTRKNYRKPCALTISTTFIGLVEGKIEKMWGFPVIFPFNPMKHRHQQRERRFSVGL